MRKTAGIALEDAERSGRKEAMYLAKVERPMPKNAPVMLRMVASKCWASVSWAEKTSSLRVRSRKADGPPNLDHGLTTINEQHRKVESKRASTRRVKKLETRLKMWVILSARQEYFFSISIFFGLRAIRWPCENPVIKGIQGAPSNHHDHSAWPMAENIYSKGTRVWFTDKEQGWISAEVTNILRGSDEKIKLTFVDDRGKVSPRVSFYYHRRNL